jgi:hypothetical protein
MSRAICRRIISKYPAEPVILVRPIQSGFGTSFNNLNPDPGKTDISGADHSKTK